MAARLFCTLGPGLGEHKRVRVWILDTCWALDCRDESDEQMCQLLVLKESYNVNVPPIIRNSNATLIPVKVNISITLLQVAMIIMKLLAISSILPKANLDMD